jgi:hypothetical protein
MAAEDKPNHPLYKLEFKSEGESHGFANFHQVTEACVPDAGEFQYYRFDVTCPRTILFQAVTADGSMKAILDIIARLEGSATLNKMERSPSVQ